MAGITIANAVRLESNAIIGCFLIDFATYEALSDELKMLYDAPEQVSGKRDEKFWVRRCRMVPGIPSQAKVDTMQESSSKGQTVHSVTASGERSVAIGGNFTNGHIITGDGDRAGG